MIISVEDRFNGLYNDLRKMGYDVRRLSENASCDVTIYSGQNTHINSLGSGIGGDSGGVLLINGDYKNAVEIDSIIRTKTYSSLF
jgi:hypothetical protein